MKSCQQHQYPYPLCMLIFIFIYMILSYSPRHSLSDFDMPTGKRFPLAWLWGNGRVDRIFLIFLNITRFFLNFTVEVAEYSCFFEVILCTRLSINRPIAANEKGQISKIPGRNKMTVRRGHFDEMFHKLFPRITAHVLEQNDDNTLYFDISCTGWEKITISF